MAVLVVAVAAAEVDVDVVVAAVVVLAAVVVAAVVVLAAVVAVHAVPVLYLYADWDSPPLRPLLLPLPVSESPPLSECSTLLRDRVSHNSRNSLPRCAAPAD